MRLDVAAVEQLAGDQESFDGLAHADVVGNQQAHRIELERHQQRHELVGARLDRDLPEAAEWSGAAPQRQQQRVAQQQGRIVPAELVHARQREPRLANRLRLQRQVDQRAIFVRPRDRTHPQRVRRTSGQHHPLAPARADQAPRRVREVAHGACPRAEASRAKAAFQPFRGAEPDHLEAELLHRLQGRSFGLAEHRRNVVPAPDPGHGPAVGRERLRIRRGNPAPRRFGEPPAFLGLVAVHRVERMLPYAPSVRHRARVRQAQQQRTSVLVAAVEQLVVGLVVVRHQAPVAGRHAGRFRDIGKVRR